MLFNSHCLIIVHCLFFRNSSISSGFPEFVCPVRWLRWLWPRRLLKDLSLNLLIRSWPQLGKKSCWRETSSIELYLRICHYILVLQTSHGTPMLLLGCAGNNWWPSPFIVRREIGYFWPIPFDLFNVHMLNIWTGTEKFCDHIVNSVPHLLKKLI